MISTAGSRSAGMIFLLSTKKYIMKKLSIVAAIAIGSLFFAACGNNSGSGTGSTDTSATNTIPPPDNNSATNPSMADTGYSHNDSTGMKKDSSKMKQ